jgi:hypothetical protein
MHNAHCSPVSRYFQVIATEIWPKKTRGRTVSKGIGIDNLANFLSISQNQTKFLPLVCLVPGQDFSATLVSISSVSLGRLSTYILFIF